MRYILLTFYLCIATAAFAQSIDITGNVTDENNQPIAGANILIKGRVTGTTTDSKGNFQLSTGQNPPPLHKQLVQRTSVSGLWFTLDWGYLLCELNL